MQHLDTESIILVVSILIFTSSAAVSDFLTRRIPNWMTLPVLLLGFAYQATFHGWSGILDGLQGFGVGAGPLLVMWLIGSGGGGDVKLMGALSTWLGFRLTVMVLIGSIVCVLIGSLLMWAWSVFLNPSSLKKLVRSRSSAKPGKRQHVSKMTVEERKQRRLMPFAIPVSVATWMLVFWKFLTF